MGLETMHGLDENPIMIEEDKYNYRSSYWREFEFMLLKRFWIFEVHHVMVIISLVYEKQQDENQQEQR